MKRIINFSLILIVTILALVLTGCKKDVMHTVIFANTNLENVQVLEGKKVDKPADPTKDGYVFVEWYADADFVKKYDFNKAIEEDTTIYAHYYLTLTKANELAGTNESFTTVEKYYVEATIESIQNVDWGNMYITDGTTTLHVYGFYNADGTVLYGELTERPVVGDKVVLYGVLGFKFEGEMKNAWMIEFERQEINPDIDLEEYKEFTIAEARNKPIDEKVIINGVVSSISKSSGYSPTGIYLVDDTGSIFVYGPNVATSVSIGNKISVAGIRANYILEDEIQYAEKFGYQGSIQLDQGVLLSNDFGTSDFETSWIEESTVKDLMEMPLTNNITSDIFKVNALITKDINPGFVNYYINDIDGKTGSYVYTMNNGGDFTWLDQYDGKICSLYLSVINAKSTSSKLIFRLIPIKIISDEYTYNESYTSEFIVKYHGVGQLQSEYDNDPAIELVTNVSSELLGFTNGMLSYLSDDTNVVYFEELDGKVIFHTKDAGVAVVTITGKHNGLEYSKDIQITVNETNEFEYVDIITAINSLDDEIIIVKGIVGSSLVNQSGFYLIDETGVIAIRCDASELVDLKLGNEVIVQGTRTHFKAVPDVAIGQTCLFESSVLVNFYGSHEYSSASFDNSGLTITELNAYSTLTDYSYKVFTITATVSLTGGGYSSSYVLLDSDGATSMRLYSSGAGQYSFLADFVDKEITVELALCNWNNKNYYTGCIISVSDGATKVINDLNFK